MARKKVQEDYEKSLLESYARWRYLYENGGQDPTWADGVNINLVRNHIIHYKQMIDENMTLEGYPEAYHWGLPPLVPQDYMAKPDEIRAAAKTSLARYLADPNYQFLCAHVDSIDPKQAKKISIHNVIGYAAGLEHAIQQDDLVAMRRHRNADSYISSFVSCVQRVRDLKPPDQMDLNWRYEDDEDEQDYPDEPEDEDMEF